MTVVVIGGVLAGLVAARDLAAGGHRVRVLEASDRPGGTLRSSGLGGVRIDVGAEAFAVTRPEALALVDELGLADHVVRPRRSDARLLIDGTLYPMPHGLLGIPTDLSEPAAVAVLGVAGAAQARSMDREAVAESIDPEVTLAALVEQRMGPGVVARLVGPVVAGVHAIDPALIEAEAAVPGITASLRSHGSLAAAAAHLRSASGASGSAIAGLRGGMTTLVRELCADLAGAGVPIDLGARVESVSAGPAGWTVAGAGRLLRPEAVVLALSAPAAAGLLGGLPSVRDPLARIHVGDVAVVSAVVASAILDEDPVGSGVLVAAGQDGIRAKAMTHATAKWDWLRERFGPGRHLVRLSYGRDGRVDEDPGALPDRARADLAAMLGASIPAFDDVQVTAWTGALVHARVGHRANVAILRAAAAEVRGLAIAGAGLGGNGIAGTIAQARTVPAQLATALLRDG